MHYKEFNFCVSEITGEGCQVEKSAKLEEVYQGRNETSCPLPLMDRIGISCLPPGKKAVEFKVYCRDSITKSMIFLGNILERRTKEREQSQGPVSQSSQRLFILHRGRFHDISFRVIVIKEKKQKIVHGVM
ncbi:MAG: hypothetical protein ACXWMJ_12300, partial [Syntrophales bacterium]